MKEKRSDFVVYAHRGASAYCPGNTFLSFYTGVYMGADGIETDVRRTADGVLVLFHDNTLEKLGADGSVEDHTYAELENLFVRNDMTGKRDRIVRLEDFLEHFRAFDLTFAIELKGENVGRATVDLIRKYGMEKKCYLTSFRFEYLKDVRDYAPDLRVGYLKREITDADVQDLRAIGAEQVCPKVDFITADRVAGWHKMGFNVRAWGIRNEEQMEFVYDVGCDGTTVDFPDKLLEYIAECEGKSNDAQ